MPEYNNSAITAKKGINFIRGIVESNGSLFQKIEQENDFGIDGIIELFNKGKPTNISIAIQVKSGESYFDSKNQNCYIPVGSHYDYWMNYSLPVYGLVVDVDADIAYWQDIKEFLKYNKNASSISFSKNKINIFDDKNYRNIFSKLLMKQVPVVDFDECIEFIKSEDLNEIDLGLYALFNNYRNDVRSWDAMIDLIVRQPAFKISRRLIYYIAHIPWHPDIYGYGEPIKNEIKNYANDKISGIDIEVLIKLLDLIDDSGIARGSIGQSIESIISIIQDVEVKLEQIICDQEIEPQTRAYAAGIYAYYEGNNAIPLLKQNKDLSEIDLILDHLYQYGGIDFY